MTQLLETLRERVARAYLHVDLDVLDTFGRPTPTPMPLPAGPDLGAVLAAIDATFDRFDVAAAALTAYDPRVDEGGAIAAAARAIARADRRTRGGGTALTQGSAHGLTSVRAAA